MKRTRPAMSADRRHSLTDKETVFTCRMRHAWHWIIYSPFIIGLMSLVWFAWRTGTKPSRAAYPCQQAAAVQSSFWLATYVVPLVGATRQVTHWRKSGVILLSIVVLASLVWGIGIRTEDSASLSASQPQIVQLDLQGRPATGSPASAIFVVNGTNGNDAGLSSLIGVMGAKGTPFYKSSFSGESQGPSGLIARDDTLIIKVNGQWNERGGTNTDLLKSLIEAIVHHPDGFSGEIVVADNGQGQYGPNGTGGSLDYSRNNAEDTSQSVQKVVDSFAGVHRVSTYLWDTITTKKVAEYSEGDLKDGYVLNSLIDPQTGIITSYPKFKSRFGSYISFKKGVWDAQTASYNSDNLKVINVPVLKSHAIYGVTASLKHYMGVGSDKLSAQAGGRMHNTVGTGGMGTEMVETRFPVLNIIDAIWVNASPGRGPGTSYAAATRTATIAASTDPVALDYWAAKNILVQAAKKTGYSNADSIDPENTRERSFGQWLRLSMQELRDAGYEVTVEEAKMNVYTSSLGQDTAPSPSPPAVPTLAKTTPVTTSVAIIPSTTAAPVSAPSAPVSVATSSVPVSTRLPSAATPINNQASARWTNIVVRVIIPLVVAAVVIGIISYRTRRKT